MKRLINEYLLTIFAYIGMMLGIYLVLRLFKGGNFLAFVIKGVYGL